MSWFRHLPSMLYFLRSIVTVLCASFSSRRDLAPENLALRQQLAILMVPLPVVASNVPAEEP